MSKRKERPGSLSPETTRASKKTKEETPTGDGKIEIRRNYPKLFAEAINNSKKRVELFEKVKAEENVYRELFARERDSKELDDPYALLLDPHAHQEIFKFVDEGEAELAIPRIHSPYKRPLDEAPIPSKQEFLDNFAIFTENQLRDLDWSNVFVAGGSVLACLLPTGATNPREKRAFYHKDAYKNSDIDLFIYGLSPEEANKKMMQIYECVSESIPGADEVIAFRSRHAVTIVSVFPFRHIQIVLRLYKSPAEVLMGFDIDACAVGFDGKSVWMSPRAHHAIVYQANTVDMTRRSPSYELRLAKYATRGFSTLIPSMDESKIDPQIFEKRFDQLRGLAKLIVLTRLGTLQSRLIYKEQQRLRKLRPAAKNQPKYYNLFDDDEDDDFNSERLAGASASDYSTVFLPWGPEWNATLIRKTMYTKDMILNSHWYEPNKNHHTHPCFFGTIQDVLTDCCGTCPPIPESEADPDSPYVSGALTWLEINPGQQTQLQRIGSFHPINDGEWTAGAFISAENEELSAAVNSNNVELTKKILQNPNVDINRRDSSGRTALHIASFSNSVECAQLLIDYGARISPTLSDGRTALHICAQYGFSKIIEALIARGAALEDEEEHRNKLAKEKKDDEMDTEEETQTPSQEERKKASKKGKASSSAVDDSQDVYSAGADSGPDKLEIDAKDWDHQFTALQLAVFFGHVECVHQLIENGGASIYVGQHQENLVFLAYKSTNKVATIKVLLDAGFPTITAVHLAAEHCDNELAKLLVTYKKLDTSSLSIPAVLTNYSEPSEENDEEVEEGKKKDPKEIATARSKKIIEFFDIFVKHGVELKNLFNQTLVHDHNILANIDLLKYFYDTIQANVNLENNESTILDRVTQMLTQAESQLKELKNYKPNSKRSNYGYHHNNSAPVVLNIQSFLENQQYWIDDKPDKYKEMLELLKNDYQVDKAPTKALFIKSAFTKLVHRIEGLIKLDKESKENNTKTRQAEIEAAEKQVKHYKTIKEYLTKKGAKLYSQIHKIKATPPSNPVAATQYSEPKLVLQPLTMSFSSNESANRSWRHTGNNDILPVNTYTALYNALVSGNLEELDASTIKLPLTKQAHISSRVIVNDGVQLSIPALFFPIYCNHADVLRRALEIAYQQYTPLSLKKVEGDQFRPTINNHDLLSMVEMGIRPGDFLTKAGRPEDEDVEFEEVDSNKLKELNSTVHPGELLSSWRDSSNSNCLHWVAYYNAAECCQAIFDFIYNKKLTAEDTSELEPGTNPTNAFVNELAEPDEWGIPTPFNLAIMLGHIETAKVLVRNGGVQIVTEDDLPEIYTGLDVGGQKMDWALEHHHKEKVRSLYAIHCAAYKNQAAAIEFLVNEAPALWKQYYAFAYPDRELPPVPNDFLLTATIKGGSNALHLCAVSNHIAAGEKLLDLDTDKLIINGRDKNGLTPLMAAIVHDRKDFVDLLIRKGASLLEKDNRGFTALHIAAEKDLPEIIDLLLPHLDEQAVNSGSKYLQLTPLIVASRKDSIEAATKLVESPKCNQFTRDAGGYYALHYAISGHSLPLVKLLSKDRFPEYFKENGVHQSVLDCAVLNSWNNASPVTKEILDFISDKVGSTRELAQYKYVRQVTDLLIEQTNQKVHEELEKAKKAKADEDKDKYSRYRYRDRYNNTKGLTTDLEDTPSPSFINVNVPNKSLEERNKLLDPSKINPKEVVANLVLPIDQYNSQPSRRGGSGRGKGGKGLRKGAFEY